MFNYRYLYLISFCSISTLMMQVSVFGEVRNVYESDGAQGIQDSINVSGAGDTVLVHDGIYYVRDIDSLGITMRDSIVFMSVNGAKSCTLSGLNSTATDTAYHVLYCDSINGGVIQGFTITQGSATSDSFPQHHGGGIYCQKSSPAIQSCVITRNLANGYGGGLCLWNSSPIVADNTIMNNSAYEGGGISIGSHSSPEIIHNTIKNNSAYDGGGLDLWLSSSTIIHNTIDNNLASHYGGGIYIGLSSSPKIVGNTITNNVVVYGGGAICKGDYSSTVVIDSCFIVDNGSTKDTKSGAVFIRFNADTFKITHSHLYYNTFQPDTEIYNGTGITIPLENNFWWDTTESGIASFIEGPADFMPFEYDFIPGVPGEPTSIDSVKNYDNNYSVIIDSLWDDPDTLYLRIYGEDRNARFREAAVAIIKSSVYPTGIAVALIETDTNSAIYEGKAIVKTSTGNDSIRIDDIYQTVRVDSVCDSLQIVANMDTAQKFVVYYRICPGVEESESRSGDLSHTRLFQNYPNPFTRKTVIRVRYSCSDQHEPPARITIYDLSGRLVRILPIPQSPNNPITSVSWDGKDKNGKMARSGVYFYKLEVGDFAKTKKMFLIK